MASLKLYGEYDRDDVRSILDPSASLVRGSGLWGIRGIIPLRESPGDFALFVTFDKQEGDHLFDESISTEGILRWQSQPKQRLKALRVRELIAHDETKHTVHLFLRTSALWKGTAPPFVYLGALKYLSHDRERERPVHIAWQLLEWPIPPEVASQMRLKVVSETDFVAPLIDDSAALNSLIEEAPPEPNQRSGEPTHTFKARKRRYLSSDQSRDLGLKGELLVLARERQRLVEAGREDLADLVTHVSLEEGDGAGHDIRSFFADGTPKYIEVKTTTGPKETEFLISPNELAFSKLNVGSFELCRVFAYDGVRNAGSSYSIIGDVSAHFELTETQYRARFCKP